jgi:hypothetical protein
MKYIKVYNMKFKFQKPSKAAYKLLGSLSNEFLGNLLTFTRQLLDDYLISQGETVILKLAPSNIKQLHKEINQIDQRYRMLDFLIGYKFIHLYFQNKNQDEITFGAESHALIMKECPAYYKPHEYYNCNETLFSHKLEVIFDVKVIKDLICKLEATNKSSSSDHLITRLTFDPEKGTCPFS